MIIVLVWNSNIILHTSTNAMNYEQVTDFSIVCCEIRSKSEVTKLAIQIRTVNTTHNWLRSVTHTRKLKFHVWLKVELILEGITDIPQRVESGTGFYIDSKSLVTLIAKNTLRLCDNLKHLPKSGSHTAP